MRVFIAWSGPVSREVASALDEWIPLVLQSVEPWMSAEDIEKGTRWFTEVAGELEKAKLGVVCLTAENLSSPWMHFEAGALSKAVGRSLVCPYLFGVDAANVKDPLAQFQLTKADKEDTFKLVRTLNRALQDAALSERNLTAVFEKWWPDLSDRLARIEVYPVSAPRAAADRTEREILQDVLGTVRGLSMQVADLGSRLVTPPGRLRGLGGLPVAPSGEVYLPVLPREAKAELMRLELNVLKEQKKVFDKVAEEQKRRLEELVCVKEQEEEEEEGGTTGR